MNEELSQASLLANKEYFLKLWVKANEDLNKAKEDAENAVLLQAMKNDPSRPIRK